MKHWDEQHRLYQLHHTPHLGVLYELEKCEVELYNSLQILYLFLDGLDLGHLTHFAEIQRLT